MDTGERYVDSLTQWRSTVWAKSDALFQTRTADNFSLSEMKPLMRILFLKPRWVASVAALILAAGFSAAVVHADDKSFGVSVPGMISYPAGSVRSVGTSLKLTEKQVTLTWGLASRTEKKVALLLNLPRFTWLGEGEPYPDRQFPELLFSIDGTQVKTGESFKAFSGKTDITELIQEAGFDPFAIAETPPFLTLPAKNAIALTRLQQLGVVEKYGNDLLAGWSAQRDMKLDLKPDTKEVTLTYKPRPGYQLTNLASIGNLGGLSLYCISARELRDVIYKSLHGSSAIVSTYVIPVSIDGRQPPSISVEINLSDREHESPTIVVVCGSDGTAKIGRAAKVEGEIKADAGGAVRILSIKQPTQPVS